MVGNNGTVFGSVIYEPGQFANGVKSLYNTNYVIFSNANTSADKGTLEFWWKPDFSSDNTSENSIIKFEKNEYVINIYHGYSSPSGGSRFIFLLMGPSASSYYVFQPSFSSNELMHIGIIWDGSLGEGKAVKLYVNGINVYGGATVFDDKWSSFPVPVMDIIIKGNNQNRTSLIDNIKLHNFIKTNFSDRFTE